MSVVLFWPKIRGLELMRESKAKPSPGRDSDSHTGKEKIDLYGVVKLSQRFEGFPVT